MTSSLLESLLEDHSFIDPSLLSIPHGPGSDPISFFDSLLDDHSPPLETQSATNSPVNPLLDLPRPSRAATLPPEDLLFDPPPVNEFTRSSTSHSSHPAGKRDKIHHLLHHPYHRPPKLRNGDSAISEFTMQAPTSAPIQNLDVCRTLLTPNNQEKREILTRPPASDHPHEQTILMLALNTYVAEIIRTCEDMQSFLSRASASPPVSPTSPYPSNRAAQQAVPRTEFLRLEMSRLQAREKNHRAVELHEQLERIAPYPAQDLPENLIVPGTGLAIRRLNRKREKRGGRKPPPPPIFFPN